MVADPVREEEGERQDTELGPGQWPGPSRSGRSVWTAHLRQPARHLSPEEVEGSNPSRPTIHNYTQSSRLRHYRLRARLVPGSIGNRKVTATGPLLRRQEDIDDADCSIVRHGLGENFNARCGMPGIVFVDEIPRVIAKGIGTVRLKRIDRHGGNADFSTVRQFSGEQEVFHA